MIQINETNFGALAICAIRYCQGRPQTYISSLARRIVREHVTELSDKDLQIMLNDCTDQEESNLYWCKKIDKPGWLRWKENLLRESERRKR